MDRKLIGSIPCNGLKYGTHIDVEVYYTKGGSNYFSGGFTPRGYYVKAQPVKREGCMVSSIMFSGVANLLFETSRFSAKQFERAVEMGKAEATQLVERVKQQEIAA